MELLWIYLTGLVIWLFVWGYFRDSLDGMDEIPALWGAFVWPLAAPALAGVLLRRYRNRSRPKGE